MKIMAHHFESGVFVREKPWHGLGTVVNHAITMEETLKLSGLDWKVSKEQVFTKFNGQEIELSGQFATVRDIDRSVLGVVGSRYQVLQNEEAFQFVEQMKLDGAVEYETAGSLYGGRTVFITAKMGQFKLLGDEIDQYLVFSNSHDGSSSVKMVVTPVRVVCANTLSLALKNHERSWSGIHTGSVKNRFADAVEGLGFANEYYKHMQETAEYLYKVKISEAEFYKILDKLYPLSDEYSTRKINTYEYNRNAFITAYTQPDLDNVRGTGWALVNAASDYITHTPTRNKELDQEGVMYMVINGMRFLQQMYEMMMEKEVSSIVV
jgi:phage/plasmid-like protein (TIGR03299 family)